MLKQLSPYLSAIFLFVLISACDVADNNLALAPGVLALLINEESTVDNKGWIITEAQTVKFEIVFLTDLEVPVKSIQLQRQRNGEASWLDLTSCTQAEACTVWTWDVNSSHNGVYSMRVIVFDEKEASLSLPFHHTLAIDILPSTNQ